jgi:hydrogenase maturation factor HypF (carbamoyltransferase family)
MRRAGADIDEAAYAFHAALARTAVETALRIREESGLNDVTLSGGASRIVCYSGYHRRPEGKTV